MQEKVIDIAEVIGTPNAILQKFGLQVKDLVLSEKDKYDKIVLDFSNLNNATTGFFHASIGNLKKQLNGQFYKTIEVSGLEKNETWKDKFEDAIQAVKNPGRVTEIDKGISDLFNA